MDIKKVVRFVLEEAQGWETIPWDEEYIKAVLEIFEEAVPELTDDGFIIAPSDAPKFKASMKEYRGTIFIDAYYPSEDGWYSAGHQGMAHDQKRALIIYNEMIDALLEV